MKRIEKLILEVCAISVLITSIFFVFAKIASPETVPALDIGRYFLILLFGFLIVAANLLFVVKKLHKILALLIHFCITFAAFFFIFVNFDGMNNTKFFIYIVLFSILYAITFALVIVIKKLAVKLDARISKNTSSRNDRVEYKSRYK